MNELQRKKSHSSPAAAPASVWPPQNALTEGAYVFITGRREAELAASVKEIGATVTGVQGDVSNLSRSRSPLRSNQARKGQARHRCSPNAGGAQFAPLGKVTEDHFDALFNGNVKGLLFTVQKALPLLTGWRLDHPECVHRRQ